MRDEPRLRKGISNARLLDYLAGRGYFNASHSCVAICLSLLRMSPSDYSSFERDVAYSIFLWHRYFVSVINSFFNKHYESNSLTIFMTIYYIITF